jgi:hypothetical protein
MRVAALVWPLTRENVFFGGTTTGAVWFFSRVCACENNNVFMCVLSIKKQSCFVIFLTGKFFLKNCFSVLKKSF